MMTPSRVRWHLGRVLSRQFETEAAIRLVDGSDLAWKRRRSSSRHPAHGTGRVPQGVPVLLAGVLG